MFVCDPKLPFTVLLIPILVAVGRGDGFGGVGQDIEEREVGREGGQRTNE